MKLSKAQQDVILHLKKGLFVWTNEGVGFKAWIGDESANKIKTVNIRTVDYLNNIRVIKFVDGNYPLGLFKYELTNKTIEEQK